MSRQLATIQIISAVTIHPNADALQLAQVLGWTVVIRTNEFAVGEKVIYLEIDSLVPVTGSWLPDPLKQRIINENIKDYYRVKTLKIRREFSQGLCITIPEELAHLEAGTDVTDLLGVIKYDPEVLDGDSLNFPKHLVSTTDEIRIQSRPQLLELLYRQPYYISEKIDGTSSTFVIDPENGEFLVCSRNQRKAYQAKCVYHMVAHQYKIKQILTQYPHLAIQGEIYGPKVQKNLLNAKKLSLAVFTVTDINTHQRLGLQQMLDWCREVGLPTVNIIETGESFEYTATMLFDKARGFYLGTKNIREGIVVRSLNQEVSVKVINNEFLLKYE